MFGAFPSDARDVATGDADVGKLAIAKPVQLAAAKTEQPKKKKKKKQAVEEDASCVQGATSIADWNPNLPCASEASASSMKLLDVPPEL